MAEEKLSILFQKSLDQTATDDELVELRLLLADEKLKQEVEQLFLSALNGKQASNNLVALDDETGAAILQSIFDAAGRDTQQNVTPVMPIRPKRSGRVWWVAASILLVLSLGTYLFTLRNEQMPGQPVTRSLDVSPGSNGAILTLSNGQQILLDTIQNKELVLQGGSTAKVINGILVYNSANDTTNTAAIVYNVMRTPKGRQYEMKLPDGTSVWLNAASSIRFPTTFSAKERRVEITGEVYFEVVKNERVPFRVSVNNKAEVEVLGTHFNINSYNNEPSLNTTLLEGSVRVSAGGQHVMLKPGQQSSLEAVSTKLTVHNSADIDKVMAWKNGLFNFEGVRLKEMMQQLERWYDIEVVYEGEVPNIEMFGKISRSLDLTEVLIALKGFGIKCRLTDSRQLVITQ